MKMTVPALIVISCALTSARAANLVNGGGFESPIISSPDPYLLSTTPAGWDGIGDLTSQGYFGSVNSGDGNQWFDLNPDRAAGTGISQIVSLVGGTTYDFSFIHNGGGGGSTTQIDFSLIAPEGTLFSGSVSTSGMNVYGGTPWAQYATTFTPTASGAATLSFLPNGSWSGGFIDAVSISSPIPEPAFTTLAISAGLGGIAMSRYYIYRSRKTR